jgi:Mrp family chromosome partitioning ATPase/capsular polysaccharide biosynthesis protein
MTDSTISRTRTQQDDDWLKPEAGAGAGGLGSSLSTLWERKLVVALIVAVCVGAAVAATLTSTKEYTAHAQVLVTPLPQGDSTTIGLGVLRDSGAPDRDIVTATQLVANQSIAAGVVRHLGFGSPQRLLDRVRVEPVGQSNVIDVAARAPTPRGAATLADAFVTEAIARRTTAILREIDTATRTLRAQIARIARDGNQAGQALADLRQRVAALSALRATRSPEFHVQAFAGIPSGASSPGVARAITVAGLIGVALGVVAAFALRAIDSRLRREAQVRDLFRLPVLTRVPTDPGARRRRLPLTPPDVSPASGEAYRRLRSVVSAVPGRWPASRSILIAGTSPREGRTTTAINLASAVADSGLSVILLEADIRRPSIARSLGIATSPTSADVVTGAIPLEDALIAVDGTDGRLRVLISAEDGSWAAQAFSLQAGDLITDAREMADVVVVDAPPLAETAELLPLSRAVDDIILVARLGRTDLTRLREVATTLRENDLRPVGVVVVGVRGPARSARS